MAFADLAAVAALGAWLEGIDRRRTVAAIAAGAAATGLGLHLIPPGVASVRGASGIASALLAAALVELAAPPSDRPRRLAAASGAALLLAKAGFELASGRALVAGPLPGGAVPLAAGHLLGAAGGAIAWLARRRTPATGPQRPGGADPV